jgi:F-type H+-transporting ATPase subunit b
LDEARRDAEHTKAEILAEAKAAAQAEHGRAMREVRNAKEAALKEIGEASANFAVDLAAKIVEKEINPADHSRLIREALVKFPTAGPSVN